MQPEMVVLIAIVAIVIAAALIVLALRRKRESEGLRERFGPEYDRTVAQRDNRAAAERELRQRQERREQLDIRPLPPDARERYANAWRDAQRRFVDEPDVALREADTLVTDVMRDRGYPMDNFDQRAADISVDHADVVENFRAARRITHDTDAGRADTETQRQAMVHYRSLFERLLDTPDDSRGGARRAGAV